MHLAPCTSAISHWHSLTADRVLLDTFKVSASSVAEFQEQLEEQYGAGPLLAAFNGAPISDLQAIPAKAKLTVKPAAGGGGGDGAFNFVVTSELFAGERSVSIGMYCQARHTLSCCTGALR